MRRFGTRTLAVLVLLALAGCASPGTGPPSPEVDPGNAPDDEPVLPLRASPAEATPWAPGLHEVTLLVAGAPATGLVAVPAADPSVLVVLAHGWGRDAEAHRADLEHLAEQGALAVAMDFRGPTDAFKVMAGVEDSLAAARALRAAYPGVRESWLYGWSMGAEVALLAAAAAPGEFRYVFAGSGVHDLAAFWAHPFAQAAVEAEAGGRPDQVPDAYEARSPIHQAHRIAAAGLDAVFLLHGDADAIVPADQSVRLADALAGQRLALYVVTMQPLRPDCIHVACPSVVGPGTHDAGLFAVFDPLVRNRLADLPLRPDSVRGSMDAVSGYYAPSELASLHETLVGVLPFSWSLGAGSNGQGEIHSHRFDVPDGARALTVRADWTCSLDPCVLRMASGKSGTPAEATTGSDAMELRFDAPAAGGWHATLSTQGVSKDVMGVLRYAVELA